MGPFGFFISQKYVTNMLSGVFYGGTLVIHGRPFIL